MPTSTPERPNSLIRKWPRLGSHSQSDAIKLQEKFYRRFPPPQEENHQTPETDWPKADPNRLYEIGGIEIIKGGQFPEGVLPINAQELPFPDVLWEAPSPETQLPPRPEVPKETWRGRVVRFFRGKLMKSYY